MGQSIRILFIHGWATNSKVWVQQVPLSKKFECLFIDLPGHGAKERWYEPSFKPAIEQITGILRDGKPTICTGWSLGGQILYAISYEGLSNIHGLVTIGSAPSFVKRDGFPSGQSKTIVRRMKMDLKDKFEETLKRFHTINFSEEEKKKEDYKHYLGILEKTMGTLVKDDILLSLEAIIKEDLRNKIERIDLPTLLVHGTSDTVCPFKVTDYLSRRMPYAEVKLLEGAGHMPFLTEPYLFNKAIEEFIVRIMT